MKNKTIIWAAIVGTTVSILTAPMFFLWEKLSYGSPLYGLLLSA